MKRSITLLAGAIILSPALALTAASGAPPAPGSISPHHETGQQVGDFVAGGGLECEDGVAPGSATRQHAAGQGSPFQEDSVSGSHYAGEQDGINNKNTTSVAQYDVACFRGPN
jgi:hypothetical protein